MTDEAQSSGATQTGMGTGAATGTGTDTGPAAGKSGFRLWMVVPLMGAFAVLSTFLIGLLTKTDDLPSTLIDRPAPQFVLEPLNEGAAPFTTADLQGPGVKLVNVWASWCVPCRAEHPWVKGLATERGLTVHGLNYKDTPEGARAFLDELGDPYTLIGADRNGRVGIEWGVYGVPETFVIDGQGRIVYKHIGPITGQSLKDRLLPAIEAAQGAATSG
ncbi:MAG: DsbE family thiol:disulfide interchange protein [Pseudomonadota bacterium]